MPTHTCATAGVLELLYDEYDKGYERPIWDLTDVPVDVWPEPALYVWNRAGFIDQLSADAKACGIRIGVSNVQSGGRGVFAKRRIGVGESVMPFSGQVVYADLMAAGLSDDAKK